MTRMMNRPNSVNRVTEWTDADKRTARLVEFVMNDHVPRTDAEIHQVVKEYWSLPLWREQRGFFGSRIPSADRLRHGRKYLMDHGKLSVGGLRPTGNGGKGRVYWRVEEAYQIETRNA